jgi:hypothetical protein
MLSETRLGQPHQLLQLLVDPLGFFHSKPCEETNMGFRWLLFEQCRMERDDIVEQCILTHSFYRSTTDSANLVVFWLGCINWSVLTVFVIVLAVEGALVGDA